VTLDTTNIKKRVRVKSSLYLGRNVIICKKLSFPIKLLKTGQKVQKPHIYKSNYQPPVIGFNNR
jgi:hypothetical protein